jgi:hypothetical protein
MPKFKNLSQIAILSQLFEDDDGLDELDPHDNDSLTESGDDEPPVPDRIILGDGDDNDPVDEVTPVLTPPSPGSQDIFLSRSRSASPTVVEPPTKRRRVEPPTASRTDPQRRSTRENSGNIAHAFGE